VNIAGQAIRQPVTVAVGVILIIMTGLIALSRIPVQLTPNVESTIIKVDTRWEGASPQEVEQEIVDRQEEKLQGVANVIGITSKSHQDRGEIRLEFAAGTSKEQALREVSDKLREVPVYPENVDEPVVTDTDPESRDYITWIILYATDPDFQVRRLQDFAEDRIKAVLERVPGVSEVNVLGGWEREVQIRFDPVRLAERGITLSDLVAAIRRTNRNVSAGQLQDGKADIRIRTVGQYTSVEQVENTVIAETSGGPVFLRDVAEVVETYKEPMWFVRSKGRPVIAINADKEIGANVMNVMDGLKKAIARLNEPGGALDTESRMQRLNGKLVLEMVYDQTGYINDALALVRNNIWLGGSLAIVMLLLFLRSIRTAGMIALAIPISVIGAVAVLVALGRSVNVISLAGMAFAVGMVVDNAIVVVENIFRHLEMGKAPFKAAYDGAREVWGAVLASTLTTIVVFIPILLIQEEAGQLFRDIAFAICAAVALSLLVSVTVIPTAAARLMKQVDKDREPRPRSWITRVLTWPFRLLGGIPDFLGRLTYRVSGSVVARLVVVIVLTGLSVVGTWQLIPPADYLPGGNRNFVLGMMFPPPGYSVAQKSELGRRIEQTIRPFWEAGSLPPGSPERKKAEAALPSVPTFDWMKQAPGAPVVPPPIEEYFLVAWGGLIFHGAISADPARAVDMIPLFQYASRKSVAPGTIAFAFQMPLFRTGGTSGSAVKINFAGPDLQLVRNAAEAFFMKLMQAYPGARIEPDPSNFNFPTPELKVVPDRVRLAEVGLAPDDLGLAVQASGDGAIIGEYRIAGQNIDLKLISKDAVGQKFVGALGNVPIATRINQVVPLSGLARIEPVAAPQQINRMSRMRAITLQFTAPEGLALEQAVNQIDAMIRKSRAEGEISPLVETSYSGAASKLKAVQTALLGDGTPAGTIGSSLALALIVTYLLMCVLFQSFIRPLVICFSVPLATFGGFAALFGVFMWSLFDPYMPIQKLDVLTMLGFVILIGVVVNNAILIVHQTLNFMRGEADTADGKRETLPPREAIAEAVRTRVRPIFMSTFTSVGGMLPLVIMPGSGSELYRGLGSVVIGGLLVSTLFTLFLVPALFSLVTSAQQRLGLLGKKRRDEATFTAAGIGRTAIVLLLAAGIAFTPGCSIFKAERDPGEVQWMLEDIVRRELAEEMPKDQAWKPPPRKSEVDKTLEKRIPELDKLAGPRSFKEDTPRFGVDLHGRPQKTVRIDLDRAIRSAVANNLGVELSRLDPDMAEKDVTKADAAFDPVLFATVDWNKLNEPTRVPVLGGIPLGVSEVGSNRGMVVAGVQKRLMTGATVTLDTRLERLKNETSGIDYFPDPSYFSDVRFTVKQPLLKGLGATVTGSEIHLAENERDRALERLKSEMLDVIMVTESAYWDLAMARRTLLIQQRLVKQGREVERVLNARQTFDAVRAEYSDALATVKQREASLIRAQRLVKYASDRLKVVMNDPEYPIQSEVMLEAVESVDVSVLASKLGEAIQTAASQRPEVRAAVLDIDDAKLRARVAQNLVMPSLDFLGTVRFQGLDDGAGGSYESLAKDDFADYVLGLSFEIPFGNRRARADRDKALLDQDRSIIACRRVLQDVILEVKTAMRDVHTNYELIVATRANRIAAAENLRALLAEEQSGRKLTPEFLNLKFTRQDRLARAQSDEVGAVAEYKKALAGYHRAVGTGLEVKRIEFREAKKRKKGSGIRDQG